MCMDQAVRTDWLRERFEDSRGAIRVIHGLPTDLEGVGMSTKMGETDWEVALEMFRARRPVPGATARDDRMSLEALQHFAVHNISWRALPSGSARGTASGGGSTGRAERVSSRTSSPCWPG